MERMSISKIEAVLLFGGAAFVIGGCVAFLSLLAFSFLPDELANIITLILVVIGSIVWAVYAVFGYFWVDME